MAFNFGVNKEEFSSGSSCSSASDYNEDWDEDSQEKFEIKEEPTGASKTDYHAKESVDVGVEVVTIEIKCFILIVIKYVFTIYRK